MLHKPRENLQHYACSLTILKLEHRYLLFREVQVLLEPLTQHDKLQSLTIYTHALLPELLDLLAMMLPFLEHLDVLFWHIVPSLDIQMIETAGAELVSTVY